MTEEEKEDLIEAAVDEIDDAIYAGDYKAAGDCVRRTIDEAVRRGWQPEKEKA